MKVTQNVVYFRTVRISHNHFRYNYYHYVVTVQKTKAQDRDINVRPQKQKADRLLSRRFVYRHLTRRALCFLHELSDLLRGVIS